MIEEYFDEETNSLKINITYPDGSGTEIIYERDRNHPIWMMTTTSLDMRGNNPRVAETTDVPYNIRLKHALYRLRIKKNSNPSPQ